MKIPCQSLSKEVLFVKDDTYIMLRVYLAISANLSACAVIDRYTCTKAAVVAVLANVSVAGSRYERRWLGLADTLAGFRPSPCPRHRRGTRTRLRLCMFS